VGSIPTFGSNFIMDKWIEITQEEKDEFVKMANAPSKTPTLFNLASDRIDGGGRFAYMTREEVLAAGKDAAESFIQNSPQ
jgi:hypothetical protein